MNIRLKAEAGDCVRVVEGTAYAREFCRQDEPFSITDQEFKILAPTGLFELAGESDL